MEEREERRPDRTSIRTLRLNHHGLVKNGMWRIQIILASPLPLLPTPAPFHPEIQTIHDGCSRDPESQHDTQAAGPPRAHESRELRCECCYHPQRRSACALSHPHSDTITDLLVFQTSVNTSLVVTSVGHLSLDSTDPLVLPSNHTHSKLLNWVQVAPSSLRKARICSPTADISFKPENNWTSNAVLRNSVVVATNRENSNWTLMKQGLPGV